MVKYQYLVTNVTDVQLAIEFGDKGDLDTTILVPPKQRIQVEMTEEKAQEVKTRHFNAISLRRL